MRTEPDLPSTPDNTCVLETHTVNQVPISLQDMNQELNVHHAILYLSITSLHQKEKIHWWHKEIKWPYDLWSHLIIISSSVSLQSLCSWLHAKNTHNLCRVPGKQIAHPSSCEMNKILKLFWYTWLLVYTAEPWSNLWPFCYLLWPNYNPIYNLLGGKQSEGAVGDGRLMALTCCERAHQTVWGCSWRRPTNGAYLLWASSSNSLRARLVIAD